MRSRIAVKLTHNLVAALGLACLVLYSLTASAEGGAQGPPAHSPADLMAAHGCWSGSTPKDMAGLMPGHVVVTVKGEMRYAGGRLVRRALEQIFEGADHGLTVHAFCR